MRTTQYLLATRREIPNDAEIISHQLMFRAGLIRKVAAGLYSWLPTGLRVLRKVENVVREEMAKAGANEILMPAIQPAELWEESGRWQKYGPELLRLSDRHDRDFCVGPTHEEVVCALMRDEIRSYKQLPANYFQIQTKFRDERRPRFGIIRSREFIMKDAYSFHLDANCLKETYQKMYDAYCRVFERLGLNYRAVAADTGSIGGSASHEFQVIAESGEDIIAYSDSSDYAANVELAEAIPQLEKAPDPTTALEKTATPDTHTIDDVAKLLSVPVEQTVKTLIVVGTESPLVALILRGDHELNSIKAEKLPGVAAPLQFADKDAIVDAIGCPTGSLGPIGLNIPCVVDRSAAVLADFVCGANSDGYHYLGANWHRDCPLPEVADLRNVVAGDKSPDGKGTLKITRGIEVGHIFQLGTQYSAAMKATILDPNGKSLPMEMGCYGIGISRIVATAIEQSHDKQGIVWPAAMAPFSVVIIPMNMRKSPRVKAAAEEIYALLQKLNIEVLFDDRDERAGVMFNDAELVGIPHQLVIGERSLDNQQIEYKSRRDGEKLNISLDQIETFVLDLK